ncbi:hypothetical protein [Croceibacterium ferulae]|uniref:hypothetical protein n=1 Tax=Croceibacterium ferulae TaxID=1854641 RepID=UPI000EAE4A7B|nr:hypothetical protein [Croceibacterium ferulae]
MLTFLAAGVLTLAAAPAQAAAQPAAAPQAATAPAPAAAPEPAADPNKRICKRFANTGSMIPSRRECRTVAEWTRIAEAAQSSSQAMIDRGRTGSLGN